VTDAERKKLEKEIQGLEARLRWDHISEGMKSVYERRIDEIKMQLKGPPW
jgi:hypothetical protein